MATVILRPITPGDLPRVLEIQALAPRAAQWKEEGYRWIADVEAGLAGSVAEIGEAVIGFLIYRSLGAGETEILNLAVAPEQRGEGFGRDLVAPLLNQTDGSVFLEVRASNAAAIAFYQGLGFSQIGRRQGYYVNPCEDAVRMRFRRSRESGSAPRG